MAQLGELKTITVNDLEENLGDTKLTAFVHDAELAFLENTVRIANRIAWDANIRTVFVSGPTSSGKTTFTQRLAAALAVMGRTAFALSLDDYYGSGIAEFDAWGRPDFETIRMLDIDLMLEQTRMLLDGHEVHIPYFDMREGRRVYSSDRIRKLPKDGILLVEGLHGLSETVSGQLPADARYGIFIMPHGVLMDGRRLIQPEEIRVFRRISRDSNHRGAPALSTIDYWPMIRTSEQGCFTEYLQTADEYVNSLLPYEFGVIPHMAADCIRDSLERYQRGDLPDSVFLPNGGYADVGASLEDAERLLHLAERIPRVDASRIPDISILNEFIH